MSWYIYENLIAKLDWIAYSATSISDINCIGSYLHYPQLNWTIMKGVLLNQVDWQCLLRAPHLRTAKGHWSK